ncbi:TDP-fucosamine acetyltransferase [Actinobacillus equuli]|nr:TDP-fucosamine acetyltransferase [Actinobacillus equuli]
MQREIAPNQWLSAFFGRDIYEIKVAAEDVERIRLVQQQGFQFVEGELDFSLSLVNFCQKRPLISWQPKRILPHYKRCLVRHFL